MNMDIVMICYKSKVKLPVHAMELGAVHAFNVVSRKKVITDSRSCNQLE